MTTSGPSALTIYGMIVTTAIVGAVVVPVSYAPLLGLLVVTTAAAGCGLGLWLHRPAHRTPWLWLQAALVLATFGSAGAWAGADGSGWLLASRLSYLLAYVCAWAVVWTLGRHHAHQDAVDQLFASALAATAGALVAFVFVVQPLFRLDGAAGSGGQLRMLFPLLSLGVAAVLLRYLASWSRTALAHGMLAAGLVGLFVADLVQPLASLVGPGAGTQLPVGLVAVALVGAATLHPSVATEPVDDGSLAYRLSRTELVVVLVAGVSGPLSLIVRLDAATRLELAVIGVGSALLVTLVLARMWRFLHASREATRREDEDRFRSLVEHTGDVVCVVAADGEVTYVSPTSERVWGYTPREMVAAAFGMIEEDDRRQVREVLREVIRDGAGATATLEGRATHGDGTWRRFEAVYANRLHDPAVRGVVVTSRDVTGRHELEQRLWNQAFVDQLTGLPNRALLLERLDDALRLTPSTTVLLVAGLDGLRTINDSLGPQRGDELLRTVGQRIRQGVGEEATVARIGGDEFALLLPDGDGEPDGEALAARALAAIARPVSLAGRRLEPAASCGIAIGCERATAQELLREAQAAMHVAKTHDRGGFRLFDPEMHAEAMRRLQLRMDLASAIDRDQLWVAYQPIHEIRTGRMVAAEALLRWDHPVRGAVPPDEFIPLAESSGHITELGEFVLRRACLDIAAVSARVGAELSISVNLSPAQLGDPGLPEMVDSALVDSGLPAHHLTLEVTEGVFLERSQGVIDALSQLRTLGVRLAIDDFGTGYCALGYLTTFRFDVVKIDRSFIRVLDGDLPGDSRVTLGMLELVAKLEVPAVAEGIESDAQLDELRAVGCEYGQGYHWSRPVPIDELQVPVAAPRSFATNGRSSAMVTHGTAASGG